MAKDKGKESLQERLQRQRKEIEERSKGKGNIVFPKAGETRIRILPVGEENDFACEVTQFYLGSEIKGVFSPATFGDPCPIMELYTKLNKSKKPADQNLAKKLVPKRKYLVPAVIMKDPKSTEVDEDAGVKLVQLTSGLYGEIIDLFLDPESGDFTDPKNGYDLKIKRVGTGKMDTVYTVRTCKPTSLPKKFAKIVDLDELVKASIPSYEELAEILEKFRATADDDEPDDEEETDRKRDKKKKKNRDI